MVWTVIMACSDVGHRYLSTAYVCFFVFVSPLFCFSPFGSRLTSAMQSGDYGEIGSNRPLTATLNSSHSALFSLPSPYLFLPPPERKAISDVRRTFCLFVTFDLLFISLLWIIELNVSSIHFVVVVLVSHGWDWWLYGVFSHRSPTPSRRA